jgi:hypothetical protein
MLFGALTVKIKIRCVEHVLLNFSHTTFRENHLSQSSFFLMNRWAERQTEDSECCTVLYIFISWWGPCCMPAICVCLVCRLLAQWLKQPLRDRHAIGERQDVVQVILQDTAMRQALRDEHLRRIPDLQALSKKLGRKKSGLQDCYRFVTCGHFRKVTKEFGISHWLHGLRCDLSSPTQTLGSWAPIPLKGSMSVCIFSVCVALCVGSGLAMRLSPVQGGLPTLYRIEELKNWKTGVEPY